MPHSRAYRASGAGVMLGGANMDVPGEYIADGVTLSHNPLISGLGNKGGSPESIVKGASLKPIAGQFTLLPLSTEWPVALNRWFSATAGKAELQKPFHRSYDQ